MLTRRRRRHPYYSTERSRGLCKKFAAQALPVVGALGGASVNYLFIEHFQEIAQGHFTVRRLERVYGKDIVRAEYERLAQDQ
jgi:hypothetical protein